MFFLMIFKSFIKIIIIIIIGYQYQLMTFRSKLIHL